MEKTIETILEDYRKVLKQDFNVYRNHVYRIYNFMCLFDEDSDNYEKYAIASVFHDIGIWTHSFDYIDPSIQLAKKHLKQTNQEAWSDEISLMIENHHKMSVYTGEYSQTVETFRKADWIDVSIGVLKMGLKKSDYKKIVGKNSNKGFHWFLVKQSLKYSLKHPFNPLPMFKK